MSIANTVTTLIRERLAVNRGGILLLKAVHELQQKPPDEGLKPDRYQQIQSFKQELPVLRTDHELDLLHFGSSAVPDFKDLRIPFESIDQEDGEGFEWPTKYIAYPIQWERKIKAEKLAVSKDVLLHLQDAITDTYTDDDYENIKEESLRYKPNIACRPVTPPLLPLTPPLTPYIPSSPSNRLPLPSEGNNSAIAEARDLEQRIMDADSLTRIDSDSSDSMLLDLAHPLPCSSPFYGQATTILKRKVEDLKVEGPLTPPILSDSPMKKLKSVTFSETLHNFIPDALWGKGFKDDEDFLNDGSDIDIDEIFENFAPYAQQAMQKLEHEKLSGADTTARMDVPEVDFTLPVAPWSEYSQQKGSKRRPGDTELGAQTKFLLRVKREDLKTSISWHGLSSLERSLPWGILTIKTAKINLTEQLHGETDFNKIHADINDGSIATSSSQVWKLEGLRIFNEGEDEDEIETDQFEESRDMESLIRKRKLEIEEEAPKMAQKHTASQTPVNQSQPQLPRDILGSNHWDNGKPSTQKSNISRSNPLRHQEQASQLAATRHNPRHASKETTDDLMFGGFSATSALHKFMETRGKAVESAGAKKTIGRHGEDLTNNTAQTLPVRSTKPPKEHVAVPSRSLPRLPDVPQHLSPCSFIISAAFLQQRSLMKQIEQLYERAEIVYRDYNRPHAPAKEADMVLSPSTGLILTTLQQIKQQPLPGQPDRSPVKERMNALQVRYERLLVVVSEGLSAEMESHGSSRPDDARDKEALARFNNFAEQLEGEVVVKYIPGGERALARSIVVEMVEYGLPHGSKDIGDIKLMAAETTVSFSLHLITYIPCLLTRHSGKSFCAASASIPSPLKSSSPC
ncbi:hypothetical protein HBI42_134640 [Parastagonospora nodorum]|nr:hypothetical protein HBI43_134030 [Parastagonospora nodorum]KAH6254141.1 hypothetical protein HBI42_134640 [Parastagonospora nodorum]